ncbi:MAG: NAD(P)H-hydrate dehydratase [Deltaproteobacteria bacterium]|nr:NAD(P)H-hydrate dehydratase [Deltaproteobacteria bacterium]
MNAPRHKMKNGIFAKERLSARLTRIVSADRMRAIEAECFAHSLPAATIMESAGMAVAERVLARLRANRQHRVTVVCGKGNNGADGMVAARHLAQAGADVVLCCIDPGAASEANAVQRRYLEKFSVRILDEGDLDLAIAAADVVVDALLGIGAKQPLKTAYARAVKAMNAHARWIVAVDVPSGVSGEPGLSVEASETVTAHAMKSEMLQLPQRAACGEIVVADIGIPDALFVNEDGYAIDARFVHEKLPLERGRAGATNVHKGTFGHVAMIGGSKGKSGAIALAAIAALRAGAGLCTVLDGKSGAKRPPAPEIMTAPLALDPRYTALCIGPGLAGALSPAALVRMLAACFMPVVLDADALNAIATLGGEGLTKLGPGPRILTPHPLELARLAGVETEAIQSDRLGHASRIAKESGAIVVLKGANTVIADPSGGFAVNTNGGRELAKGGSGDVLAGIIAGLIAQKPLRARDDGAFVAAAAAVHLHALAAEIAGEQKARASVLASDICERLPDAMRLAELRARA